MFAAPAPHIPRGGVVSPRPTDLIGRIWLPGGVSVPVPVDGVNAVLTQCDSDVRVHLTDGIGLEGIDCREAVGQPNPTKTIYTDSAHPVSLALGTGSVSGAFWVTMLAGESYQRMMSVGVSGGSEESYEFVLRLGGGIPVVTMNITGAGGVDILDSANSAHRVELAPGMDYDPDMGSVTGWIYSFRRAGANSLFKVWHNGVLVANLTIDDTNAGISCDPTAGLAIGNRSVSNGALYGAFYAGKIYPGVDLNDYEAQEIARWGPMINPPNVRAPAITAFGAGHDSWASPTVAEYYDATMTTSLGAFDHPSSDPITNFVQWPGGPPASIQSLACYARSDRVIATQGASYLHLWTPPDVGAYVNVYRV